MADGTSFRESNNLTGLCNCNGNGSVKSQCGWPSLSPNQQIHSAVKETVGERKIGRERKGMLAEMKITGSLYLQLFGGYNKLAINVLNLGKPLSDYRVCSVLT